MEYFTMNWEEEMVVEIWKKPEELSLSLELLKVVLALLKSPILSDLKQIFKENFRGLFCFIKN